MTIGILLAAGAGRRLGRGPKALLPYRGSTLVEHHAQALIDGGCHEVIVVVGAEAESVRIRAGLARHSVVVNSGWTGGIGSSLRTGVAAAQRGCALMIVLVDQPGVDAHLVQRLIAAHRHGRITAAAYRADNGELMRKHPILFDGVLARAAARAVTGDSGARGYLKGNPRLIDLVDCSDLGNGLDVDVAADLPLLGDGKGFAQS